MALLFVNCGPDKQNRSQTNPALQKVNFPKDTPPVDESINEEDTDISYNGYLSDRLKPIRANFRRINSIAKWTSISIEELFESTEGGEAKYYYLNSQLEKIVARHYGETYQMLIEYYLLNAQISFVLEKRYKFNRPIYYDSATMKENNDTETFDFEKSELIEDRSYFENGKLIHQVNNHDCGSPFADDYLLEEENRILTDFGNLIKLRNQQQIIHK